MRHRWLGTGLAIIAPAIWCGVAFFYWQHFIGLPPAQVVRREGRQFAFNQQQPGQVALFRNTGPVQIVNVSDGRVRREVLDGKDRIMTVIPGRPGIVIAERDGQWRIADLETGSTRCSLPDIQRDTTFLPVMGGEILLVRTRDEMTAVQIGTGKLLWSVDNVSSVVTGELGRGDVILLTTFQPQSDDVPRRFRKFNTSFVNVTTGQPDPRYRDTEIGAIDFSPDGRLVALRNSRTIRMLDATTCQELWRAEKATDGIPRFNRDGSEIQIRYLDGERRTRLARWSATDGRVINPLPRGAKNGSPVMTDDEQFSIQPMPMITLPRAIVTAQNWLRRRGVRTWERSERVLAVVDNRTDEFVAPLAGASDVNNFSVQLDASNRGVIVPLKQAILYYPLPPQRNLRWIVKFGVTPAAAMALILGLWATRARRIAQRKAQGLQTLGFRLAMRD